MNHKLSRQRLRQLKETLFPGLRVFFSPDELERAYIPSDRISFHMGPMINSKGRLDHPEMALRLLTTDEPVEAYELYQHLDSCNKERKSIQKKTYQIAEEQVLEQIKENSQLKASVVYSPDLHEGVIGIVASRLVESFHLPAIVFTDAGDGENIKASARTAGTLNLFSILDSCKELFLKFGGHKAAAGLTMPRKNLQKFKEKVNEILSKIPKNERVKLDSYDSEIMMRNVNVPLLRELQLLEPFGQGNASPLFKISGFDIETFKILKDVHVKWSFSAFGQKISGISFNTIGKWGQMHPEETLKKLRDGEELSLYGQLQSNFFRSREYLQILVNKIF